jgi:hypothetical protein
VVATASARARGPLGKAPRQARSAAAVSAAPVAVLLLAAAPPPSPASLELLLEAARQPLPYLVLVPGAELAEVQIRGLAVDSLPVRAVAVVAPRGRLEECRGAAALPAAFTVGADAAQPLRQRFEPVELVEDEAAEEAGEVDGSAADRGDDTGDDSGDGSEDHAATQPDAAPPLAATAPSGSYRVALEQGWTLVVGPRVTVASPWRRIGVSLLRGLERLFGGSQPTCELQVAAAPDDARRLQHLFRPGVRVLLLQR